MMPIEDVAACWDRPVASQRPTVSLEPASAYEAVTRQMVVAVNEELREIKARLNGLLFMVAGSVLLDVALRLATGGS
ncbi:MAG: hypothetical protein ACRDJC_09915 [Thermomicrobiales bacterium]